jgi:hypothetical protein
MHFFILNAVVNVIVVHSSRVSTRSGLHRDSNSPRLGKSFLEYGFRSAEDEPGFLAATRPLFDLPNEAIDIVNSRVLNTRFLTTETICETAEMFGREAGIDGSYGAFSAVAQASTEKLGSKNVRQIRVDAFTRAEMYHVTMATVYPHRYLKEEIKTFLLSAPPSLIVSRLGEFYAEKLTLGGLFQSTHVTESIESESKRLVEAVVKGNLSFLVGSSMGELATETTLAQRILRSQVSTTYTVKGGDVSIWLRLRPDNENEIHCKWGSSVTDRNLHPVQRRLQPLWHLLEHSEMNHSKGEEIKEYLLDKWDQERRSIPENLVY